MSEQARFKKNAKVWWSLTKAKKIPGWIPKQREDQAGEVIDAEGDTAVIGVLNENRKVETYIVPMDQLRHRDIA